MSNRREFLKIAALGSAAAMTGFSSGFSRRDGDVRRFGICANTDSLKRFPDYFDLIVNSGITDVWMPVFLNGYWPYQMEEIALWKSKFEKKGIVVQSLSVPLGHPGSSLGGDPSLDTTPANWPKGIDLDGKSYSGTSVHNLITKENQSVIQKVRKAGFQKLFLDDDFRLARSPGQIGGCFCNEHQTEFLNKYGYGNNEWVQLKQNIKDRELSTVLRSWIEFICDDLTHSFRVQQAAAHEVKLGIMVMYLGSEKAGIRLSDYNDTLFRVGELMFEDKSFNPLKGKTNELFSALFHRRFVKPEMAYSETTAYPADKLSATNMAAKLHITTIADIRNTMMMSGLEPFPLTHFSTFAPVMKKAASIHKKIAGQVPQGPFKHFWGTRSRMVGKDQPNSLFLATGIPFEVTNTPAYDGWTFLSEYDIDDFVTGKLKSEGTTLIHCSVKSNPTGIRYVGESIEDVFAFKRDIISQLKDVPYIEEDKPVVCTWYPKIKSVLLWNLAETKEIFTLKYMEKRNTIEIGGLDAELIRI